MQEVFSIASLFVLAYSIGDSPTPPLKTDNAMRHVAYHVRHQVLGGTTRERGRRVGGHPSSSPKSMKEAIFGCQVNGAVFKETTGSIYRTLRPIEKIA